MTEAEKRLWCEAYIAALNKMEVEYTLSWSSLGSKHAAHAAHLAVAAFREACDSEMKEIGR